MYTKLESRYGNGFSKIQQVVCLRPGNVSHLTLGVVLSLLQSAAA